MNAFYWVTTCYQDGYTTIMGCQTANGAREIERGALARPDVVSVTIERY